VYAVLTVLAQWLFVNNSFAYTVLMSLGAAVFGAGLAFLLIEAAAIQERRGLMTSRVAVFIGLAFVFVVLVLVAQFVFANNPMVHTIFVSVGAATFGGGLTFFLLEMFSR
jgi:hypothetical protein